MYEPSGREFCTDCLTVANKTNEVKDCSGCSGKMPELSDDLAYLLRCFSMCDNQLIIDGGGAWGINFGVIIRVAQDMGITTNGSFYKHLRNFEITRINGINRKAKEAMNNRKINSKTTTINR